MKPITNNKNLNKVGMNTDLSNRIEDGVMSLIKVLDDMKEKVHYYDKKTASSFSSFGTNEKYHLYPYYGGEYTCRLFTDEEEKRVINLQTKFFKLRKELIQDGSFNISYSGSLTKGDESDSRYKELKSIVSDIQLGATPNVRSKTFYSNLVNLLSIYVKEVPIWDNNDDNEIFEYSFKDIYLIYKLDMNSDFDVVDSLTGKFRYTSIEGGDVERFLRDFEKSIYNFMIPTKVDGDNIVLHFELTHFFLVSGFFLPKKDLYKVYTMYMRRFISDFKPIKNMKQVIDCAFEIYKFHLYRFFLNQHYNIKV